MVQSQRRPLRINALLKSIYTDLRHPARNGNVFLAWDLSQMPPGQSFEMTQEKPVLLILKLRRANNFVINVIVYSEYDSEIEMMNNRKVICHEYA